MEEYTVLRSQQAVSPDTIINPDEIRFHEIEDEEECDNKEPKPKRKASAGEIDNSKKAKLDQWMTIQHQEIPSEHCHQCHWVSC